MSKFFLFYILAWLTRNPLLALLIVVAVYFFLDRRFIGLLPDFSRPFRIRREISQLKREVMLNPHNGEALSNLGRDLVRMKKYGEGVEYLERALEKMSDIPETQFYLGLGYLSLNKMDKAREHLSKTVQLEKRYGYGEPYLRLGDYYTVIGDPENALSSYEAFTGIHTSSSEGFYKIGMIWLQQGDMMKAREFLQQSVHAFRGSPPHKKRIDRPWFWKARIKLFQMK